MVCHLDVTVPVGPIHKSPAKQFGFNDAQVSIMDFLEKGILQTHWDNNPVLQKNDAIDYMKDVSVLKVQFDVNG